MTEEGPTGFYIDTKLSPVSDSSTSTDDIAVEHPSTGILGEDIGGDDDDKIVVYVAPDRGIMHHPRNGKLASAQTQKRLLPPTLSLSLCLSIRKRTILRTPALPPVSELKLWPAVPKGDIVPAPSPVPVPVQAFKKISFSLLSSPPKPRHRASWPRRTALRKAEQRRGDSDVDWGGSTSGWVVEVEVSDDGYARGPGDWGRCDDCVLTTIVVFGKRAPRSFVLVFRCWGPPHAIGQLQLRADHFAIAATRTLTLLFVLVYVLQADPRLVLQVTRANMMREELSSMKVGAKTWIRTLGTKTESLGGYRSRAEIRIFRAIYNGKFEVDLDDLSTRSRPLVLAHSVVVSQNARGITKKAERASVCASELERITGAVAIVDPFTPKKRCGKTAHKATRQAAASFSLETVIGHIQHFVQDLGSAPTLSLTTARNTRNSVLSGAHAFSMKSQSEGKDSARFTRLIETTLSDAFAWILVKSPPPHGSGGAG
ncbi:hypothetical protein EDB85DRAFT_2276276 [Lactarius pseudohatsudake]|nr:hypothetical protein EDB85DRAFT_2276276 [Lactarius pseudohatsudake]